MKKIGRATIHNMDCMDYLKGCEDNQFDLAIVDPPYGLGDVKGTMNKGRDKNKYNSFVDTLENVEFSIVPRVLEAIRISKVCIVTPGPKALTLYPNPDGFGVFYQPATVSMSKWGRSDAQPIFYYGKDPDVGLKIKFSSYKLIEKSSVDFHPCAKPLRAWEWLIMKGLGSNGLTVFDPFLGSGTTAIATNKHGFDLTACELDPDYYNAACERIQAAYDQPDMFTPEPTKPEQVELI